MILYLLETCKWTVIRHCTVINAKPESQHYDYLLFPINLTVKHNLVHIVLRVLTPCSYSKRCARFICN